ncbi:MAG: T9SS type A sorting domain-containing protein [Taibaiella sp.]|nr:T9SS type A sorting domain-containing protein [Taibaiella sp.]
MKIGFRWVNNNDGTGTDPSFAVDSISLSTASGSSTAPVASFTVSDSAVCQDSCITFISTSTGTVDSVRWSIPGVSLTGATNDTLSACFANAGYFTVHLYAYQGTAVDSTTRVIRVRNSPHPSVTQVGHVLTVAGTYSSYQWYKTGVAISGATGSSYTYTTAGTYMVMVDSGGCKGTSAAITYNLGVAEISATGNRFSLAQSGELVTLFAALTLQEALEINIYDATGRLVLKSNWSAGADKIQLPVTGIAAGMYVIRIGNATTSAVLKWLN